jgi:hypothetical protein
MDPCDRNKIMLYTTTAKAQEYIDTILNDTWCIVRCPLEIRSEQSDK